MQELVRELPKIMKKNWRKRIYLQDQSKCFLNSMNSIVTMVAPVPEWLRTLISRALNHLTISSLWVRA